MQDTPSIPGVSVRRRLAVGGMAELFLAEETLADGRTRACVIKRLLPGAGAEAERLFAREALALAALTRSGCAHVVELYRAGPGWILLEWVDGVDLATLIERRRRRGRPLPLGAALAVVEGLGRALEALGRARDEAGQPLSLVHRDVHPGNVLLGRDGAVKLADLGVVGLAEGKTQAGLKGTLAWMAPEQLTRGETSAASDLYSAALVAYEAFTGQPSRPVGAAGLAELLQARSVLPTAPGLLRAELAGPLGEALLEPLAIDPAARPEVSAWVGRLVAASPVAPDPGALGALVAEAAAAAGPVRAVVGAAPRTVVAGGEAPAAVTKTGARWAWAALVIALAGGGVGAWRALASEEVEPLPVPGVDAGEVAEEVAGARAEGGEAEAEIHEAPAEVGPVASAEVDGASEAEVAASGAREDDVGPDDAGDAADAIGEAADAVVVARIEDARRGREVRAAAARVHRVRVEGEGALHVRGGGVRGLVPYLSPPLAEGEALALHVTGGSTPFSAVVRVRIKGERVVASIGAGRQPEVYEVACGGAPVRETPVFGLAVGAGGLSCRLTTRDGRSMSFVLSDVVQ